MAEELMWCWNSPRNLFSSSPQMIMDMRSSDDPPINSGDWNHDFLRDIAKSEENNINYCNNFLLDSKSEDSGVNSISLLQTLLDTDSQPQQSLLVDMNSNGFLPPASEPNRNIWSWSSTAAAPSTFLPSPQSHFIPNHNHTPATYKPPPEQAKDSITTPLFKRPRIETPSPLPTFKVRKEKLGDRITALQQLVSPFGKTDTASVLNEAIDYIKFLHDQVNALSTPYLKYGSLPLQEDKAKDEQGLTKELKTRGLCLVPISSTFPVAAETTTDFWTPTFAGCFR